MTTRDVPWPAGTPCWVDCSFDAQHRGLHHAKDFYEKLFGWRIDEVTDEAGYLLCSKDDRYAAGIGTTQHEQQPTTWVTYLATEDAAATCAAVQAAGGQVAIEPAEIPGMGILAFCIDPTGAFFGLWQAQGMAGFGIVSEPDTVTWVELLTRDVETAKTFYTAVFGYSYDESTPGYAAIATSDGAVVGAIRQDDASDSAVPSYWLVHFAVVDRDSSAQIAQELDAEILLTADTPLGPEAVIQGKHGEVFGLVEPKLTASA